MDRVISTAQLRAHGYSQRRINTETGRNGSWTRLHRGVVLLDREVHRGDEFAGALLAAGPGAALSHLSAAEIHELPGARALPGIWRPDTRIEVTIPPNRTAARREGIRAHRSLVRADELDGRHELPVTNLQRTLSDVLPHCPTEVGVVMLDHILNKGRLVPQQIAAVMSGLTSSRNVAHARRVLDLARRESESPLETISRLRFLERGLAPDGLQQKIVDGSGRFLGRVDFTFRGPRRTVIGEADGGGVHRGEPMRAKDSRREAPLWNIGYAVVRWTWAEIVSDPDAVVARIRSFL